MPHDTPVDQRRGPRFGTPRSASATLRLRFRYARPARATSEQKEIRHDERACGTAGRARRPRGPRGPARGLLHGSSRPRRPRAAGGLRDLGSPGLVAAAPPSTRPTSWPRRRPSAPTDGRRASAGRSSWLATRTRLSEPAFLTALEVLVADGVDVRIDSADGYTPTPALSHAILTWNREHPGARCRRHRGDAVAQPARGRRLQVQPAQRRARRRVRHARHRGRAPTPCCARGLDAVARVPAERARAAADGLRLPGSLRGRPAERRRHGRHRRLRPAHRRGPAGRRRGGLLGGHRRATRPRTSTVTNAARRPDLRLHDPRLGRPDPHGPLVRARHGPTHRPARPTSTWRSATTPTPTASAS